METEKFVHRLDRLEKIKTKTCPSCSSVFITEKECESCGLQFKVDTLGEPYSDKSFYGIREKFLKEWPIAVRTGWTNLNPKSPEVFRYKRFLEHRMGQLMNYFFNDFDASKEKRKLFLIELEDLVLELRQMEADLQKLLEKYDSYFRHPLYRTISDMFLAAELKPITKTSMTSTWWNEPLWGLIRPQFIAKCVIVASLVAYLAIVVFPYLAIRR
ncbi:MAG: hypothetical protein Fur0010_02910 [Bdellovibrio sp.]